MWCSEESDSDPEDGEHDEGDDEDSYDEDDVEEVEAASGGIMAAAASSSSSSSSSPLASQPARDADLEKKGAVSSRDDAEARIPWMSQRASKGDMNGARVVGNWGGDGPRLREGGGGRAAAARQALSLEGHGRGAGGCCKEWRTGEGGFVRRIWRSSTGQGRRGKGPR